jgi:intracellular sulfur oxidation DsrE/DsrF family protein
VYRLEFPDIDTAVGISGPAFPMNASDKLWAKYRLGERSKIVDPTTKQPAVRNIFLDGPDISVKAIQGRGTVFWQCNVALGVVAQQLAAATQMPVEEVRADLLAGLNPGVRLVPSHVMALALVQERGFTYMKP